MNSYIQHIREEDPNSIVDLGNDHAYVYTYGSVTSYPSQFQGMNHGMQIYPDGTQGVLTGIIEMHKNHDGEWCGGYVSFVRPIKPSEHEAQRPLWKVNSLEPLDIEPSLLCRGDNCDNHGWIKNGEWVY